MSETFPHLFLNHEEPITEKRPGGRPMPFIPDNPPEHGRKLKSYLKTAIVSTEQDIGGFDDSKLFRFSVTKGFDPDTLRHVSPEIEFVSQEGEDIVIAFVSSGALESFEARLTSMIKEEHVKYKQVLYALQSIGRWKPEDRMGWALKLEGFPKKPQFILDIELWPIEDNQSKRVLLWEAFEDWLAEHNIEFIDSVKQAGLTLFRVKLNIDQANLILTNRDVRIVDLPPKYGIEIDLFKTDIDDLAEIPSPPDNAPGLVILDSGVTTGHPMLAPAIGDAQSFLEGKDASDENGHGTMVAGLGLYGDIEAKLLNGQLTPKLRLFSGRILDENNKNSTGFIEKQIDEAVRYFTQTYGCKIFNLSFGDSRKPYLGGHIRGLSFVLDTLSRELDVLFIVSSGNVSANQKVGLDWKDEYPAYMAEDAWAIIEPAPALNVITVGSLARYDQTRNSQRYSGDPAEVPIARQNQPSPFSRRGHSIGGAIKPEFVSYGGNWALNTRGGANIIVPNSGLGELSTNSSFVNGKLLADQSGTSMAAPQVANLAALIHSEYDEANRDIVRALLVCHASIPSSTKTLLEDSDLLHKVCGYGQVDSHALFRSLENEVTMIATGKIGNKRHHFYEIPIPEDFISQGRREREISIGLSYTPYVRSTRLSYKASRIEFKLVPASDLNHVTTMFNKATKKEDYESIPELGKRNIGSLKRNKGTVQGATWSFTQFNKKSKLRNNKLFVVVTRNDFPWGEPHNATYEPYAITVCFRDRNSQNVKLYTQVQTKLQVRGKTRVRI
jgi:Subtilase family